MKNGVALPNSQQGALLEAAKKAPKKNVLLQLFTRSSSESSEEIEAEADPEEDDTTTCDVREVWFVGGHSGKC